MYPTAFDALHRIERSNRGLNPIISKRRQEAADVSAG
jgi:hypothetical protein